MRRRGLLERLGAGTGAITMGTVAGCLQAREGESDSETEEPGTVVGQRVASESVCAEGSEADQDALVTITAAGVELSGSIESPTPCYDAALSTIEFVSASELAVTVGLEAQGGVCRDCLGRVDYTATIEIEGTIPETVTVTHDAADGETEIENATAGSD
ncbi:hypothetical protein [Natrinema salinisoli]|uniref:hypothetical protein n=1 Tax=Natrinema salinisoli TaxID=2878535 RepID=UPI001CF0B54E|nr:hypothetical protein [Natrinema salinisoli]